jgi:hypothetical protein
MVRAASASLSVFALVITASSEARAGGETSLHVADPTRQPKVTIDVGLGGAKYGESLGEAWGVGPAYRIRAGLQLDEWFAIDAGYFGAKHIAGPGMTALATTFDVSLRVSLPIPGIRPFVTVGMGTARVTLRDDVAGVYRAAPRFAFEVPLGAGVEFRVHPQLGFQIAGTETLAFAGGLGNTKLGRTHLTGLTFGARIYF